MYVVHTSGVRVFQKSLIPALSSAEFFGFVTRLRYSFIEPQTFSIGFKSGLEGGVHHQLILFEANSCALDRCPVESGGDEDGVPEEMVQVRHQGCQCNGWHS